MGCACCASTTKPARATTSTTAIRRRRTTSLRWNSFWRTSGLLSIIGEFDMTNTVTIGVASREEINARFKRAMTTGERTAPFIGFADERALWSTLTPLRWDILKVMTGAGPLALREIAR